MVEVVVEAVEEVAAVEAAVEEEAMRPNLNNPSPSLKGLKQWDSYQTSSTETEPKQTTSWKKYSNIYASITTWQDTIPPLRKWHSP